MCKYLMASGYPDAGLFKMWLLCELIRAQQLLEWARPGAETERRLQQVRKYEAELRSMGMRLASI